MEFHFGVVNTIATVVTVLITLLNIIVYKLRQIQEANLGEITSSQSQLLEAKEEIRKKAASEQLQNGNLEEISSSLSSSLRSRLLCRHFPIDKILLATNSFDDALVIGRGGFGKVYKGVIDDGAVTVAIKRLNPLSRQGAPQFWTEVKLLSKLRHSHIVSLIGYCHNPDEMILVYEYMPRGSLADHLYKIRSNLSWIQRVKICIGAAQGLDYLHTGTGINNRVIHRDMKSSNILLDDSWAAKVSDFGLSKIGPANQDSTHVSTNVKGTHGYLDPEYITTYKLTRKSDVYSFGVVLLEVLSGKQVRDPNVCEEFWDLTVWAKECIRKKEVEEFIDPYVKYEILPNSLKEYAQIAEKCLQYCSRKRPTMAEVVASLERVLALQERTDSSMFDEDFMNLGWNQDNQENPDDSIECNKDAGIVAVTEGEVTDVGLSGIPQSHARPSRTTPFKRFTQFFKGKPRVSSGSLEKISELGMVGGDGVLTGITVDKSVEFSYEELAKATDDFSLSNKIGLGGFGAFYYGELRGKKAAIKKMEMEQSKVFLAELKVLTHVHHPNLVRLIGYCVEGYLLLIYEFVDNGNLRQRLNCSSVREPLSWSTRVQIALDTARGLEYIHEHTIPTYIHRDIKPSSILIDTSYRAKVAGFGLAKVSDFGSSKVGPANHNSTDVITNGKGTLGYLDPEYMTTQKFTRKSDVYSFGVVLLEVLSGKQAPDPKVCDEFFGLAAWATECIRKKKVEEIVDPYVKYEILPNSLQEYVQIAEKCLQYRPRKRPTMAEVVASLEHVLALQEGTDSSMSDEAFMSLGRNPINQENPDVGVTKGEVTDVGLFSIPQPNARPSRTAPGRPLVSPGRLEKTTELRTAVGDGVFPGITIDRFVEFSYEELAKATDDFGPSNIICQRGYGVVYYAELRGEKTAIKKLAMEQSKVCLAELKVLTHVHHPNLVRLIGYCVEGYLLLIYEFVDNGNLRQRLNCSSVREPLSWSTRVQIALDTARGLEYIHEHTIPTYIHLDIRPSSILIDTSFRGKVAGFGQTEVVGSIPTHISGFFEYMPPEYLHYGDKSPKIDVYAFGVVLYELLSAKDASINTNHLDTESRGLVTFFDKILSQPDPLADLCKAVDPMLGDNYPLDSVLKIAHLAKACSHENPEQRPSMRSIVVALVALSSTTEDL